MMMGKAIVQRKALVGCDFWDCDKVYTLASADWLTRKLTITFGAPVREALIARFHRVADFRIELAVRFVDGDVSTGRVARLELEFEGVDEECLEVAGDALRQVLGIKALAADNDDDMRALMEAVERHIPRVRDYFDF